MNIDLGVNAKMDDISSIVLKDAMEASDIDSVALLVDDEARFNFFLENTIYLYKDIDYDRKGLRFSDDRYVFKGKESLTKEGICVATIGHCDNFDDDKEEVRSVIDRGLLNDALVIIKHPYVDNYDKLSFEHISNAMDADLKTLCREYSGKIAVEWNSYFRPDIRESFRKVFNYLGNDIRYSDVNSRASELCDMLKSEGYNVPLIANSDLYARGNDAFYNMGISRISTDVDKGCPKDVLNSIKDNIFSGDYKNSMNYFSKFDVLTSFIIPKILSASKGKVVYH